MASDVAHAASFGLATALATRYERQGSLDDLDAAIRLYEEGLDGLPADHPSRFMYLSNLGGMLESRFGRLGGTADLDRGIEHHRQAVALLPLDASDRPNALNNLGTALRVRFRRHGRPDDLDEAIRHLRQAVAAGTGLVKGQALHNLGAALAARFNRAGDIADIDASIGFLREAIVRSDDFHRPSMLSSLGQSLLDRGGPCLVAQGLTSRCAHTLDLMLRSILGPDGQAVLPTQFVKETQLWAHTALRLSDAMLRRAGLHRGIAPPQRHGDEVFVPGEKTLTALREAVRYRFTDLSHLLRLAGWGIRPGEHTLTTGPGPDDGLVVKPLLLMEDGLIVANPAELVTALRHELIVQAGLHECRPQLARLLRDQTMRDPSRLLTLCGAVPTGPAQQTGDDLITRRTFTFAEDKILDLAVVMDDLSDYDDTNPAGHWPIRDLGLRVQNVIDPVGPPLPEDARILRLIINEGVGRSSFLGLADQRRPVVVTSLSDLQVMAELDGSDPLFLWRFAQAETELHETTHVQPWSALDNYGLYRNCEYSYYVSDDTRPTMLLVKQDHSRALRVEVQQRYDRHDVPSPHRPVYVPVVSVYGTSTAPIYRPLPDVPEVGRLVEVPDVNVWLGACDHEVADGLKDFHHLTVEAAAFWTWQISTARPDLLPLAASTGELYVSLSFDDPSAWQAALDGNPGTESERPWSACMASNLGSSICASARRGWPAFSQTQMEPTASCYAPCLKASRKPPDWWTRILTRSSTNWRPKAPNRCCTSS
jgi:hypothetical protein